MSSKFDPEINHQYHASRWSSRKDTIPKLVENCSRYSQEFRKTHAKTEIVKYGNHGPRQLMDLALPGDVSEDSPIFLFIHGGYWVETEREMFFFVVENATKNGWIGASVGYDQAPSANMTTIVTEVRESYIYLSKLFPKSREMIVSGHSAGGQLAAMLLATDWNTFNPNIERFIPITRCVPICGVMDLRPIVHISYDEQLHLTEKEIRDFSPVLNVKTAADTINLFGTKVACVVAEEDPPTLREVSQTYTNLLKEFDVEAKYVLIKGVDHFQIIERLSEPNFELHKILQGKG